MPILNVSIDTKPTDTKLVNHIGQVRLNINAFVPIPDKETAISITASELISSDNPNNLNIGSDKKLVSQPPDIDFLAYYILAKS